MMAPPRALLSVSVAMEAAAMMAANAARAAYGTQGATAAPAVHMLPAPASARDTKDTLSRLGSARRCGRASEARSGEGWRERPTHPWCVATISAWVKPVALHTAPCGA